MCRVSPGLGRHLLGVDGSIPTTNKRVQTVSDFLLWEIIPQFGVPASSQSDNGPEFTSQISQTLSKALDIPWHFPIPYHPQSSGKVERTNHSLKTTLVKLSQELHLDWVKLLPLALFRLWALPKQSLLISPFELMYWRPVLTHGLFHLNALPSTAIFILYCLSFCSHRQEHAQDNWNLLQQKLYCLLLQEQKREWQNPIPFKENYPPPRTCRSLIGCSPLAELSSWGRQSTWSGELPLAHAQIICLPLRTQDVSTIL
jgi:transposase InsO family protein